MAPVDRVTISALSLTSATRTPLASPTATAASKATPIASHMRSSWPPDTPSNVVLVREMIAGGERSMPRPISTRVWPIVTQVKKAAKGRMDISPEISTLCGMTSRLISRSAPSPIQIATKRIGTCPPLSEGWLRGPFGFDWLSATLFISPLRVWVPKWRRVIDLLRRGGHDRWPFVRENSAQQAVDLRQARVEKDRHQRHRATSNHADRRAQAEDEMTFIISVKKKAPKKAPV